jgi:hypothetical protein
MRDFLLRTHPISWFEDQPISPEQDQPISRVEDHLSEGSPEPQATMVHTVIWWRQVRAIRCV